MDNCKSVYHGFNIHILIINILILVSNFDFLPRVFPSPAFHILVLIIKKYGIIFLIGLVAYITIYSFIFVFPFHIFVFPFHILVFVLIY